MAMLNVRVPSETEDELEALAQERNSTKSDIAREAISAYLSGHERSARGLTHQFGDQDEFAEFGDAVRNANRKILSTLIDTLVDAEWEASVEPVYQLFKARAIKQTKEFGAPRLAHRRADAAFLLAPICFAEEDDYNRTVPLHELIYQYLKEDGEEAMARVRAAVALAEKRLADDEAAD